MKPRVFAIKELFLFFLIFGTIVLLYDRAFYRYLEKCIIYLSDVYNILDCLSVRLIVAILMFILFLFICFLWAVTFHFLSVKLNKFLEKK